MPLAQVQVDEALLPLLRVSDEPELQHLLARIVSEHAEPIIKDIIRYKLRAPDHSSNHGRDHENHAEDIYNDAIVQLLVRLKEFKANPQHKAISNLRSYVAVIAYNSCYRHLRLMYPQRHVLKNRLRYLLTRQAGFALWEGANKELTCGFAVWKEDITNKVETAKIQKLNEDPRIVMESGLLAVDAQKAKPAAVLAAIFNYAKCPLKLDELVNIVARLWGIKDQVSSFEVEEESGGITNKQVDFTIELDQQEYLKNLWSEIVALPVGQRAALLLNLRDSEGRGCIELFHLAGLVTIKQMAAVLNTPLATFAALWNDLPLDDLTIAERLGLTRQQVINLRKSARARLARRMKVFQQ